MRSRSRAFTLIELLTVIAIIGVLAAIIIGSVSKVRDAARRSTCVSNLRQIGTAFQLYAADNRGLYPALRSPDYSKWPAGTNYSAINPPPGTNPSLNNWQVEISRYVFREQTDIQGVQNTYGTSNIAHCPTYDLFFNTSVKMSSQSTISTAGYGMNNTLNVGGSNYSATWGLSNTLRFPAMALNHPAKSVLVGDSSEFFINVSTTWIADTSRLDGYSNGAPKRHGSVANYLFADGHVETLSPEAAILAAKFKN